MPKLRKRRGKCWIGFDLGGTKMLATVFDAEFHPLGTSRQKTKGLYGVKAVLGRIQQAIENALEDAHVKPSQIAGLGFGFPGSLDLTRGVVLSAPNLGWRNVTLKRWLDKHFSFPSLLVNDVDAGAYGEYRFGAGRGARCLVGVFPGTGIGGACIYDGRLIRGATTSAFEIGHLKVQSNGRLCGCGKFGCLETVASRLAIASEVAAAIYRGEAEVMRELAGTDLSSIKSAVLAAAIKKGDATVNAIVRNAARLLGSGVAAAVNLMAPDRVVLGGGLVEAMPKLYLEEVRRGMEPAALTPFLHDVRLVAAALGDDAGVLGAAALAAEEFGGGR